MKPVTTVTPGAYYIAKVPCPDCKVEEVSGERENRTSKLVDVDNDLVSFALVVRILLGCKQARKQASKQARTQDYIYMKKDQNKS